MKPILGLFAGLVFAVAGAIVVNAANAPATIAFVDVTVIPMDAERVLPRQTVVVQGDRIVEVGAAGVVKIPADARRIEGAGKFLMPGLAEMHGHFPPVGSPAEFVENVAFLYVANGVTTVRSMLGSPGQLEMRERAKRGEFVAPTLTLAGPSFSGQTVRSADAAIERVKAQKAEGWDLLKVHPGLTLAAYTAMAKAARESGLEFSGHVPAEVGLVRAIELGQRTIDHLDGYIEHLDGKDGPIDPARLNQAVRFSREKGTWVVPTMVLWETILGAAKAEELAAFPELKYMPRAMVESWKSGYAQRVGAPSFNAAQAKRIAENRKVLLKAVADGGVKILFGTDAPQQFSVPGFSVHREMRAMREAGLSNYAILASATARVGDYDRSRDRFGTVAAGQRADLLLLEANPLSDVANVAKRVGVMVRGQWLSEGEIRMRLERIAAAMAR